MGQFPPKQTYQTLSSFGVTDITVVVAVAGHTGSQQRAGSPTTTFWKLPSVVPRSTVLTGVSSGARRTDTELQLQCHLVLRGRLNSLPANLHGDVGNSALLQSLAVRCFDEDVLNIAENRHKIGVCDMFLRHRVKIFPKLLWVRNETN